MKGIRQAQGDVRRGLVGLEYLTEEFCIWTISGQAMSSLEVGQEDGSEGRRNGKNRTAMKRSRPSQESKSIQIPFNLHHRRYHCHR